MPYERTHVLRMISDAVFEAIRVVRTARLSLEYWSLIMMACWFSLVVFESEPKLLVATNSNGFVAGTDEDDVCVLCCC